MNDTSPEIEQKQFEMMMGLGPNRRIELACEMYMVARNHIFESLPSNLSDDDRRKAFVAKMYGRKFSEAFFKDEIE